jgi:undecaprenyl-diphosphatase
MKRNEHPPAGAFVLFELIADIAKLAIIVAGLYYVLVVYVRIKLPAWSDALDRRQIIILLALVLASAIAKISEDVLSSESGIIDNSILLFIHRLVPAQLIGLCEVVTFTGSFKVLIPLAIIATAALWYSHHRFEAQLMVASVLSSSLLIYAIKTLVGRTRPALWSTEWYWGSSFPSGHTLAVAAFATAAALCVSRIRPAARKIAFSIAATWIILVAVSRLVLGVHWPTDVLAAACIGAFLPLMISIALEIRAKGKTIHHAPS